jgi:hypothetical protein
VIDLLWFLYLFGVLAFGLGLVLAYALRPTPLRVLLFLAAGLVIPTVLLAWAYFSAPTDARPEGCSDCTYWQGRYWEPGFVIFCSILNLVGWAFGSLIGLVARIQTGR